VANHGGGYQYRLCKLPAVGRMGLTEECFQQTPLSFDGDVQWVQYGGDTHSRTAFDAVRTAEGTFPHGSQWTRNPIPACNAPDGGYWSDPGLDCANTPLGTQFGPPAPASGRRLFGFGQSVAYYDRMFPWTVVDRLRVPKHLEPGKYVVSWRWDSEQTWQVWNTCADVHVVSPASTVGRIAGIKMAATASVPFKGELEVAEPSAADAEKCTASVAQALVNSTAYAVYGFHTPYNRLSCCLLCMKRAHLLFGCDTWVHQDSIQGCYLVKNATGHSPLRDFTYGTRAHNKHR
jgi:hypothetical protein